MYKAYNMQLPVNLQNKFSLVKNTERYTLRCHDEFKVNHTRTTQMSQCISSYGVRLYNSLPDTLRNKKQIVSFKSKYVKLLLNQYI